MAHPATAKSQLQVQLLAPGAQLPVCAHPGSDLGFDLFALEPVTVHPSMVVAVRTGIAVSMPGFGFVIRDRSSMGKKGVFTHGGVIDEGYRGEILVLMSSTMPYTIQPGDKIAQMIPLRPETLVEVVAVEQISTTERGEKGFGSTGS